MKEGNIVDLCIYRKRDKSEEPKPDVSKELQLAIKRLIQRMRKQGPLKRVKRA